MRSLSASFALSLAVLQHLSSSHRLLTWLMRLPPLFSFVQVQSRIFDVGGSGEPGVSSQACSHGFAAAAPPPTVSIPSSSLRPSFWVDVFATKTALSNGCLDTMWQGRGRQETSGVGERWHVRRRKWCAAVLAHVRGGRGARERQLEQDSLPLEQYCR